MLRSWQGFKKGDVVEMTQPLADCLEKKKVCKILPDAVEAKVNTAPKKTHTRKPRKRKKKD